MLVNVLTTHLVNVYCVWIVFILQASVVLKVSSVHGLRIDVGKEQLSNQQIGECFNRIYLAALRFGCASYQSVC